MVPLAPPDMTSHDTKLKCKNGFTRFFNSTKNIDFWPIFFRLKNPNLFHDFSCCGRKTDGNPVWGSPALIRMRRRWKGELAPSTFFCFEKFFPPVFRITSNYWLADIAWVSVTHNTDILETEVGILCSGQTLGSNEWKVWPEVSKAGDPMMQISNKHSPCLV